MQSTLHKKNSVAPGRILAKAAVLGILGDLLLRPEPGGLGLALWLLGLAVAGSALALRSGLSWRSVAPALGLAALGSAALLVRESPLYVLLVLGGVSAVAVGAIVGWRGRDLRSTPLRGWVAGVLEMGLGVAGGSTQLVSLDGWESLSGRIHPRARVVARGLLVALPVVGVFLLLFVSADPLFERYAERTAHLLGEDALEHAVRAVFLSWIAGGLLWALLSRRPLPEGVTRLLPRPGAGEALVVLLLVDLLFGSFVLTQLRYLFGGKEAILALEGLTLSHFARRGFFELVAASALVLPVLLWLPVAAGGRAGSWLRRLALALLVLVGAVLASAADRMALYVSTYGLTDLRIYASAAMAWIALTFVWLGWTVLRGRPDRFPLGALVVGGLVVGALGFMDPAGTTVRVNAERAEWGRLDPDGGGAPVRHFDVTYATRLGPDAVPELVPLAGRVRGADRCRLVSWLLEWSGDTEDWRSWTWSRSRARRSVLDAETELRRLARPCPASPAPSADPPPDADLNPQDAPPRGSRTQTETAELSPRDGV